MLNIIDGGSKSKQEIKLPSTKMSPSPEGQEERSSPGACYKGRISGPAPKLLNQNLHFNKIPEIFMGTLKFDTQVSNLPF